MIRFDFSFLACFTVIFEMVMLLCQCLGTAGKLCNPFLPSKDKDSYSLCTSCRCKECNAEDRCSDCHDSYDEIVGQG